MASQFPQSPPATQTQSNNSAPAVPHQEQLPVRFKGFPYVFKRRQPALNSQQTSPSDPNQGRKFIQSFVPLPSNPICDDLDLPLLLERGLKVVPNISWLIFCPIIGYHQVTKVS